MTTETTGGNEGRGLRSPGYPSCDLKEAMDRVRVLKDYSPGRKPIPIDSALKALGYSPRSGGGLQLIATLKKFGLLDDSGSLDTRSVRLSDLAHQILVDVRPISPARDALIRKAALTPKIHAEIRERWPHGVPDESTVHTWLAGEKSFNEKYIPSFLKDLQATFEYAKLDSEPEEGHNSNGAIKVGDFVQWTLGGSAQFPTPRQVVRIDEKDGEKFAAILGDDGQEGWAPMSQLAVENAGSGTGGAGTTHGFKPPVIQSPLDTGIEESRWKLPSGNAILRYPQNMTEKDFKVLQKQIALLKFAVTGEDDE